MEKWIDQICRKNNLRKEFVAILIKICKNGNIQNIESYLEDFLK